MTLTYQHNAAPRRHVTQDCPCCGQPVAASLLVSVEANRLSYRGKSIKLRGKKAMLADVLARCFGRVVTHERIYLELWDDDEPDTAAKAIQVHVCWLRKALAPLGLAVETSYGRGYRMITSQ